MTEWGNPGDALTWTSSINSWWSNLPKISVIDCNWLIGEMIDVLLEWSSSQCPLRSLLLTEVFGRLTVINTCSIVVTYFHLLPLVTSWGKVRSLGMSLPGWCCCFSDLHFLFRSCVLCWRSCRVVTVLLSAADCDEGIWLINLTGWNSLNVAIMTSKSVGLVFFFVIQCIVVHVGTARTAGTTQKTQLFPSIQHKLNISLLQLTTITINSDWTSTWKCWIFSSVNQKVWKRHRGL